MAFHRVSVRVRMHRLLPATEMRMSVMLVLERMGVRVFVRSIRGRLARVLSALMSCRLKFLSASGVIVPKMVLP